MLDKPGAREAYRNHHDFVNHAGGWIDTSKHALMEGIIYRTGEERQHALDYARTIPAGVEHMGLKQQRVRESKRRYEETKRKGTGQER